MARKKETKKEDLQDYVKEVVHNEESFKILLKNVRPDIFVLMDLLDNTGINPYIIFHVIKYLNNIIIGTNYGKVVIEVERGMVTYIRGEESTMLKENLKKEDVVSGNI